MPRRPQDLALLQQVGERVRRTREAAGLTQQRLADLLDVRAATVSQLEAGALSPTLTTAAAIARVLHVRLADLLDFDSGVADARPAGAEEVALLEDFRALDAEQQRLIRAVARGLVR